MPMKKHTTIRHNKILNRIICCLMIKHKHPGSPS